MLNLIVYSFRGDNYLAFFGEGQSFKTKQDVLRTEEEREVFTIVHVPGSSYMETLRQLLAEADKRGIKDFKTSETVRADHTARKKRASKSVN